jgi:hypothetical protein
MTRLEEEMYQAINGLGWPPELASPLTDELRAMAITEAKLAAEVAKRYIEKAFYQSPACTVQTMCGTVTEEQLFEEFLKSEGITEQPGIVVSNGITSTE